MSSTREELVRSTVAAAARADMAASPLYGRERALLYALGFMEPRDDRSYADNVATVRAVYAGLRDAEVIP